MFRRVEKYSGLQDLAEFQITTEKAFPIHFSDKTEIVLSIEVEVR